MVETKILQREKNMYGMVCVPGLLLPLPLHNFRFFGIEIFTPGSPLKFQTEKKSSQEREPLI